MEQKNIDKIIKLTAGNNYSVLSIQNNEIEAVHCKCGYRFKCTTSYVAAHGFHCDRCEETPNTCAIDVLRAKASADILNQCSQKLPKGFKVYGDTSDVSNTVTLSYPGIDSFEMVIDDLLNDRNLPDCLIHRDAEIKPSIQLQLVDKFMHKDLEILDDFTAFTDVVRVKDNITLTVTEITVQELIEEVVKHYDTNYKQISTNR